MGLCVGSFVGMCSAKHHQYHHQHTRRNGPHCLPGSTCCGVLSCRQHRGHTAACRLQRGSRWWICCVACRVCTGFAFDCPLMDWLMNGCGVGRTMHLCTLADTTARVQESQAAYPSCSLHVGSHFAGGVGTHTTWTDLQFLGSCQSHLMYRTPRNALCFLGNKQDC